MNDKRLERSFVLSMLAIPVINNNTWLSCGKFHFGRLKYFRSICYSSQHSRAMGALPQKKKIRFIRS